MMMRLFLLAGMIGASASPAHAQDYRTTEYVDPFPQQQRQKEEKKPVLNREFTNKKMEDLQKRVDNLSPEQRAMFDEAMRQNARKALPPEVFEQAEQMKSRQPKKTLHYTMEGDEDTQSGYPTPSTAAADQRLPADTSNGQPAYNITQSADTGSQRSSGNRTSKPRSTSAPKQNKVQIIY